MQNQGVKYSPQYHTACQIQKKVLEAMGLEMQQKNQTPKPIKGSPQLKPSDLCSLAKAWETIEERKRILRMKGLPKAVDSKEREKKPLRATFTE